MQLCSLSNIQKILNCETDLALRVLAKERYTCNEFWLSCERVIRFPYLNFPTSPLLLLSFFLLLLLFGFFTLIFPEILIHIHLDPRVWISKR